MTSGDTLSWDVSSPQWVTQCDATCRMNIRFRGKNCVFLGPAANSEHSSKQLNSDSPVAAAYLCISAMWTCDTITALLMKMHVFWVMMPRCLVEDDWHEGAGVNRVPWNVSELLPDYAALNLKQTNYPDNVRQHFLTLCLMYVMYTWVLCGVFSKDQVLWGTDHALIV
jgi:hypothetical protein